MKSDKGLLSSHLFVCTNTRADKASCGGLGSVKLREQLKADLKANPACKGMRVNSAGCLGRCEEGIVAVMYPQGKWFVDIKAKDFEELKKQVIESL
jgi:(2Fe-2S) ferredoxin